MERMITPGFTSMWLKNTTSLDYLLLKKLLVISMNTISFPVAITNTPQLIDQRKKAERDNVRTLLSYFKQYDLI